MLTPSSAASMDAASVEIGNGRDVPIFDSANPAVPATAAWASDI